MVAAEAHGLEDGAVASAEARRYPVLLIASALAVVAGIVLLVLSLT